VKSTKRRIKVDFEKEQKEESCSIMEQDQQQNEPQPVKAAVDRTAEPKAMPRTTSDESRNGAFEQFETRPFHGAEEFPPAYELQKEDSQHRIICYLSAEGNTTKEIADKTGFTPAMVAYVKKQPWATEFIAKLVAKYGGSGVKAVLQGAALDAAKTIVAVMNDEANSRPEVRAKCANDILDRLYGTAPKICLHGEVSPEELSDEELAMAVAQRTRN